MSTNWRRGKKIKNKNQKAAWIWVRRPNRYNSPFLPASTPHLNSTVQMAEQGYGRNGKGGKAEKAQQ